MVGLDVVGAAVGLKVGLTSTTVTAAIADTVPMPVLACRVLLKMPTAIIQWRDEEVVSEGNRENYEKIRGVVICSLLCCVVECIQVLEGK